MPARTETPALTLALRIGGVPYGVGAPLLAGLDRCRDVDLVQAPPTRLIELLRAGQLDAALVSSVEAIRRPGYRVAAGLGIACKREIRSVRAFRRLGGPIRSVGVDAGSATSVALLRLLLANPRASEVGAPLQFTPIEPTLLPAALPHDLVLLIGDAGLAADPGGRDVWDLGREWVAWTGLPFVFALWVVHPEADLDALVPALAAARRRGRSRGAIDGTDGAAHYDLDADDRRGLRRYWAECRALGLASGADPVFVGPAAAC